MAKRAKKDNVTEMPKSPRSQALPGHEKVIDQVMENLGEEIRDARANISAAKKIETSCREKAMQRMIKKGLKKYNSKSLIGFLVEPGEDVLSIKMLKGDGTVSVGGESDGDGDEDPGGEE